MTADDVVYSFTYYMSEAKLASARPSNLTKVEKIDDYNAKFTFSSVNYSVLNKFASQTLPVLDAKTSQGKESSLAFAPNGTGPFKFTKKENDVIYLERNDKLLGRQGENQDPYLQAHHRRPGETHSDAEQRGRHRRENVPDKLCHSPEGWQLNSVSANIGTIYGIVLNSNDAALKDIRVRQAISYAVDNSAISAIATDGKFKVADTILPVNLDKNIGVKMHTYDVAKASSS